MMNKENIFKDFKVGYKGDYSLRIEVEVKEYSVVRIITSGVLRRSTSSYIGCLDDVVEHEGMEEDTEENIDVMVY